VTRPSRSAFWSHPVRTRDGLDERRFPDAVVADENGHRAEFETVLEELRDRSKCRGPDILRQNGRVWVLAHRPKWSHVSRHTIILPESEFETVRPTLTQQLSVERSRASVFGAGSDSDGRNCNPPDLDILSHTGETVDMGAGHESLFIAPMLASTGPVDLQGANWAFEPDWAGMRVQIHKSKSIVALFNQRGEDLSPVYPLLVRELSTAIRVDSAIIDGVMHGKGLHNSSLGGALPAGSEMLSPELPPLLRVTLTDVLQLDDVDASEFEYDTRRQFLTRIVRQSETVTVTPSLGTCLDTALKASDALGAQSIVAKRRSSRYLAGKPSRDWVTLRISLEQDVMIAGWRESVVDSVGAVLLAVPGESGLEYAGVIRRGWDRDDGLQLARYLRVLHSDTPQLPDEAIGMCSPWQWVRPGLIATVAYLEHSVSARSLHPVWRAWHPASREADI